MSLIVCPLPIYALKLTKLPDNWTSSPIDTLFRITQFKILTFVPRVTLRPITELSIWHEVSLNEIELWIIEVSVTLFKNACWTEGSA